MRLLTHSYTPIHSPCAPISSRMSLARSSPSRGGASPPPHPGALPAERRVQLRLLMHIPKINQVPSKQMGVKLPAVGSKGDHLAGGGGGEWGRRRRGRWGEPKHKGTQRSSRKAARVGVEWGGWARRSARVPSHIQISLGRNRGAAAVAVEGGKSGAAQCARTLPPSIPPKSSAKTISYSHRALP